MSQKKIFKYLSYFSLVFFIGTFACVIALLVYFSQKLPSIDAVENYEPRVVTQVFANDDRMIAEFATEKRMTLSEQQMPKIVINAFVAAEDDEFFHHRGINPVTILRAALRNFQAGSSVQGGSTITQQVAKSMLLTPEKSFARKIKEMLLAFRIEKALSKKGIINLYLNQIFLGQGAYGVEAASLTYFGKPAAQLGIAEAAILAGLPRAPSRDNPVTNAKFAKQRQMYVLGRMLDTRMISKDEYEKATHEQVQIKNLGGDLSRSQMPYFTEYVRRYIQQKYGSEMLYGGGLKVYTTVDFDAQLAAQKAIKNGLIALDKRVGFRSPEKRLKGKLAINQFLEKQHKAILSDAYDYKLLTPDGKLLLPDEGKIETPLAMEKLYSAVVVGKNLASKSLIVQVGYRQGEILPVDYAWASLANSEEIYSNKVIRNPFTQLVEGDVIDVQAKTLKGESSKDSFILSQQPLVQGALLSYRLPDGALNSLVGGYDFYVTKSEFNRATQAIRQPGSTFKPLVFAAALESGLTPATMIVDSPIVYGDAGEQNELEKVWKPGNYNDKFYGDTSLRNALAFSRNIPAIKLMQHLKVSNVIDFSRKLGVTSKLSADLSLALGSSGMSLQELLTAWATFADGGRKVSPYFIRRIEDRNDQILEEHKLSADPVSLMSEGNAYLMTSMLQSVVEYGTATSVRDLGRPVAGKTGTTSDYKDAWFVGYVPQLITGVWTGFDEDRQIGRNETGSQAAAPIWLEYMKRSLEKLPVQEFKVPESVVQVQIDADTGDVPGPMTKKRRTEFFVNGTAPGQPVQASPGVAYEGGASAVNKTRIVTGNADFPGASEGSSSDSNENAPQGGTDELYRDEF